MCANFVSLLSASRHPSKAQNHIFTAASPTTSTLKLVCGVFFFFFWSNEKSGNRQRAFRLKCNKCVEALRRGCSSLTVGSMKDEKTTFLECRESARLRGGLPSVSILVCRFPSNLDSAAGKHSYCTAIASCHAHGSQP